MVAEKHMPCHMPCDLEGKAFRIRTTSGRKPMVMSESLSYIEDMLICLSASVRTTLKIEVILDYALVGAP